jgi:imidazolonepropionase
MSAPVLWHRGRIVTAEGIADALVTEDERIAWAGAEREVPAALRDRCTTTHDLAGRLVTPGLIDCHTHLVFAGQRADEFAARLRGESYEAIARRGGGILSTMRATRAASDEDLFAAAAPRLRALVREGVTTIEIKSGYGLTLEDEARMLSIARRLGAEVGVDVVTTCLAAHTVPPEFAGRADDYIHVVAREWLPELAGRGLVDAVDIYCDRGAFTAAHAEQLFEAAGNLRLPVKMHAAQFAEVGGVAVAARHRAQSCDHLEELDGAGVSALASAGSVAVLLPVAYYCLQQTRPPPITALREQGVPMAVASDCNPGTAPTASLLLAMNMACRLFGLGADEAFAGATLHAARALGLAADRGVLAAGKRADFAVWDAASADELAYWSGFNPCRLVVRRGVIAVENA